MKQKRTRIDRNIDIDEHGKYHISLYYGYENGKYKRKSVTCSTKEEAIDIRDKHECDVRFYGKASTNTKITVAELTVWVYCGTILAASLVIGNLTEELSWNLFY